MVSDLHIPRLSTSPQVSLNPTLIWIWSLTSSDVCKEVKKLCLNPTLIWIWSLTTAQKYWNLCLRKS